MKAMSGLTLLINNDGSVLTSLVTFTWDSSCSSSEDNILGYLDWCSGRCFLSSSVFCYCKKQTKKPHKKRCYSSEQCAENWSYTSTNIQLVFKRAYVWDACLDPKIDYYREEKVVLLWLSIWKNSWGLSRNDYKGMLLCCNMKIQVEPN